MGRKLGQHFLEHRNTLERIAEAVCPERRALVIEIGPGKGALTEFLLERAARVVAIEVDWKLVASLRRRFATDNRLEVVHGDVLKTDLAEWGAPAVAGNLPYYITSPIIEKVLQLGATLETAVFLVQEEVANRLTAEPGSRDYGYLTVQTRLLATPEKLFRVPATAFRPPPKVDSAVVRLTPVPGANPAADRELLEFVSLCFRHKRKTLRNNLADRFGRGALDALSEAESRAEQLSVEQFRALFRRLSSPGIGD